MESTQSAGFTQEQIEQWQHAGDTDGVKNLIRVVVESKDADLRTSAIQGLRAVMDPSAPGLLIQALKLPDPDTQASVAEALGELSDDKAIDPLMELLSHSNGLVKARVIEALGNLKAEKAVQPILRALQDKNHSIRMIAAESLGKIKSKESAEPLISAFSQVQAELRRLLGDSTSTGEVSRAQRKKGEDAFVLQWRIATALGRIGGSKAVSPLVAWGHRLFKSQAHMLSADDKQRMVTEVMAPLLEELPESELYALQGRLQTQTKIMSWQTLSAVTELFDWLDVRRENPIWTVLQAEIARRMEAKQSGKTSPPPTGPLAALGAEPSTSSAPGAAKPADPATADSKPTGAPAASPSPPSPLGTGSTHHGIRTSIPDRLPPLRGIAGNFLKLLADNGMDEIVLVGGVLRDILVGQQANDLDVTVQVKLAEEMRSGKVDPAVWNRRLWAQSSDLVEKLAQVLSCSLDDLIDGKAAFRADGVSMKVHYVGPFMMEKEEVTTGRLRASVSRVQHFSRLGIVADLPSGNLFGLVPVTQYDNMWVNGRQQHMGNYRQAIQCLKNSELDVDQPADHGGWIDIFRILYLRHRTDAALTEGAYSVLVNAAECIKRQPEAALSEFSPDDFERLVVTAGLDVVSKEIDWLGVSKELEGGLDAGMIKKLADARQVQSSGVANDASMQKELADAQAEVDKKQKEFESKSKELNEVNGQLAENKERKTELEEKLREKIQILSAANEKATETTAALADATSKMSEMSQGGGDVSIIKVHREALAEKQRVDAEVGSAKREVEQIRRRIETGEKDTTHQQGEIVKIGQQLEAAMNEMQIAKENLERLRNRFETLSSGEPQTAEEKRQRLMAAP